MHFQRFKRRLLCIVLCTLMPCVTNGVIFADETAILRDGIIQEVTISKKSFRPLEPVVVTAKYTNHSESAVVLRNGPVYAPTKILFNGKPGFPTSFGRIHGPFSTIGIGKGRTVILLPGDVCEQRILLNQSCDLTLAGKYDVDIIGSFKLRDAEIVDGTFKTYDLLKRVSFVVEESEPFICTGESSDELHSFSESRVTRQKDVKP